MSLPAFLKKGARHEDHARHIGSLREIYLRGNSIAACAAANLAIGTLNGEQLT